MEWRKYFRPGWRMIAAIVAITSGPISAVQSLWVGYLTLTNGKVPGWLVALPVHALPLVAIIALTALYLGEVALVSDLERQLGRRPSHRIYVQKSPEEIIAELKAADRRVVKKTFYARYRGRWISGTTHVVSIGRFGPLEYVSFGTRGEYMTSSWGQMTLWPWQRWIADQLEAGDEVSFDARIVRLSTFSYLDLSPSALTVARPKVIAT